MRYLYWARRRHEGDLGESVRIKRPVLELVRGEAAGDGELAVLAMLIALAIGIPAGVLSAVKNGTWIWDYAANVFALWGLSTPNFWLGIMLILLFSVHLGWLPASGYVSPVEDLGTISRR